MNSIHHYFLRMCVHSAARLAWIGASVTFSHSACAARADRMHRAFVGLTVPTPLSIPARFIDLFVTTMKTLQLHILHEMRRKRQEQIKRLVATSHIRQVQCVFASARDFQAVRVPKP